MRLTTAKGGRVRWFDRAEVIRKRIRPKLTGEKIGEIMGRSRATIYSWLNGTRNPSIEELAKILGVSVQQLVDGDEYTIRDDDERAWIAYWRSLSAGDREVMARTLGVKRTKLANGGEQ